MYTGKSVKRVDAFDKVTGRTTYTDDLCDKKAYVARVLHSTVANGKVVSFDLSEAEKVPGVVKILTCFDLKERHYFPTAGHPWSTDPGHQDVADRLILTDRVRFYGDDIAAVVAADEVAAQLFLDDRIAFPWFKELPSPEEIKAYSHFIAALCEMALNQKRITAKEKPVDNDKYAFRCFLLRLGFIGDDYKTERKILLRNLSGSSAFKSGAKKTEVESCE